MHELTFFPRGDGLTLSELATLTGASLGEGTDASLRITGIAALSEAGSQDLSLFDSTRYSAELAATRAGCVLVSPKNVRHLPSSMPSLVTASAAIAFTQAGRALFPGAVLPTPATGSHGVSLKADIHREAKLEDGVTVEAFASIGPGVEIGRGTIVGAGSVIGAGCRIGRNCRIGSNVTLTHTLLGDRVILHPGVRIGQDGFGYTAGPTGLVKAVQIGRVIIQDDVEIGANTTVDRGGVRDTVIGEGTKIDNQVQIAHNVRIGRHCVIVAQVGISGSATLGDGVMIGGQTGVNGHLTIADGAQIAAVSSVAGDVPKGARWGGTPAKPVRDWFRELTTLSELAQRGRSPRKTDE